MPNVYRFDDKLRLCLVEGEKTIIQVAAVLYAVSKNNRKRYTKNGFTLVELLVVVLIIGILTAVALSQYNITTDKTKLLRLLPLARSVKNPQEMYYLENGHYAKNWEDLGTDILPFPMRISGDRAESYERNLRITLYGGTEYMGVGPYSPDFLWIWNYDHGPGHGRLDCYAYNDYAQKLRKRICTSNGNRWIYTP